MIDSEFTQIKHSSENTVSFAHVNNIQVGNNWVFLRNEKAVSPSSQWDYKHPKLMIGAFNDALPQPMCTFATLCVFYCSIPRFMHKGYKSGSRYECIATILVRFLLIPRKINYILFEKFSNSFIS